MKPLSPKIIIIGAGIAGLAAYQQLRQDGFHVTILEARNQAGGRIRTDNTLGIPVNCGAGWIHGIDHNPITALALETHTAMKPFDPHKNIRYDSHGKLISRDIIDAFDKKFESALQQAQQLALQSENDIPLSEALKKIMPVSSLNAIELDLLQFKLNYFQGYIGADYQLLSARFWNLEETWPGDNCYLTGTYQPIIDHLAKDANIQFNTLVKEINLQKNSIEILTDHSHFSCDFVICTLPLGVLQKNSVIFNPALPPFKLEAIHRLGMGLLNVTIIKFPRVFWPKHCHAFSLKTHSKTAIPIFFNLHAFLGEPILMGYHGGENAKRIEHLTHEELEHSIMQHLKNIFGEKIPAPEALMTTRWSEDPLSYGSYSYVAVGASAKDYDAIAEPVLNRLFFAGEATHAKYLATTHGAYLSGIREANRIKQLHQK